MLHEKKLNSSVIKLAQYDDETKTLTVKMKDRQFRDLGFKYYEVPKEIFDGLVTAESAGKFFNEKIQASDFEFDKL